MFVVARTPAGVYYHFGDECSGWVGHGCHKTDLLRNDSMAQYCVVSSEAFDGRPEKERPSKTRSLVECGGARQNPVISPFLIVCYLARAHAPPRRLSMQYQSPRYEGDISKAYRQLVGSRIDVRASLSTDTLKEAYVHFFGDLQRRTEVSLVRLSG